MKNHFDTEVKYNGKFEKIRIQILSNELPKLVYAVWPQDVALKKYFENMNLYFIADEEFRNGNRFLNHRVFYDCKCDSEISTNMNFEFAVWEAIMILNYCN